LARISLKLGSKVTNSKSPFFSVQCIYMFNILC
jgi:hypothetical protein